MDKLHELFLFLVIQHGLATYITGSIVALLIALFVADLDDGEHIFGSVATAVLWPAIVAAAIPVVAFFLLIWAIKELKKSLKSFIAKGRV